MSDMIYGKLLLIVLFSFAPLVLDAAVLPVEDPDFEILVELAQQFDLPMPDPESELVLATRGWSTLVEGSSSSTSRDPGIYHPAFVVETDEDSATVVLFGTGREAVRSRAGHIPGTRQYSLVDHARESEGYWLDLSHPSAFVTVIQLAGRGEIELADELWSKIKEQPHLAFPDTSESLTRLLDDPKSLLAMCIYDFYYRESLNPGVNMRRVYSKLATLRQDFPDLFSDRQEDYFQFQRNQFVNDLRKTVEPGEGDPGAVESLLLTWGDSTSEYRHLGYFSSHNEESDAAAREIFRIGLPAIVQLKSLADDQRLTQHVQPAMMRAPERRLRIGDLAKTMMKEMCGSLAESPFEDLVIEGESADSASFFVQAACTRTGGKITALHVVPLYVLAEAHPESLGSVVDEVVADSSADLSWHLLCQRLAESGLSKEKSSELMCQLFESARSLGQKRTVLQSLIDVDESACVERLMPVLEGLPTDVQEPYWTCEAANFVHTVMQCQSNEAWEKYLEVVKRSAVGLRMEMMNPMNYTYVGDTNNERRIAFLAEFLDDAEVRDRDSSSTLFQGPCAAMSFPRIEVRNYVAMKIASLLPEKFARPDEFWTDDQWTDYRNQIAEHVGR